MNLIQNENFEVLFRLLVNKYRDKVIRFISLFVNDKLSCEELASDIFVSLWLRRDILSEITDFDNYFFVAAKNKALDFLRKKHEESLNIDDLPLDFFHYTETTPESIYISNETAQELNNVINTLPTRTRLAFHLVREEKKTYKEAAEILSVSVKTIEKQVATAVEKLKKHLKNKKNNFFDGEFFEKKRLY